jgi:hypothetical protein
MTRNEAPVQVEALGDFLRKGIFGGRRWDELLAAAIKNVE